MLWTHCDLANEEGLIVPIICERAAKVMYPKKYKKYASALAHELSFMWFSLFCPEKYTKSKNSKFPQSYINRLFLV